MRYMGSKNRIAKHTLPIMLEHAEKQNLTTWVEPFVGGGNMIDKVPDYFRRKGYDLNPHVIMALRDIRDRAESLPEECSEEYYKSLRGTEAASITSWLRFVCAFGGDFEHGFAKDSVGGNYAAIGKRNALKQSPKLQGVSLGNKCYSKIRVANAVVYCDPPYQNTSGYKTGAFDHEAFFDWCRVMANDNLVFVSEYNAPNDFIELWAGECLTNFASNRKTATHRAVEKLFLVPKG